MDEAVTESQRILVWRRHRFEDDLGFSKADAMLLAEGDAEVGAVGSALDNGCSKDRAVRIFASL